MPNNHHLFESLHADYYPMVYQMCKGFVKGDEDQASDLAQEAFIHTWRSLSKFRGASSYKTWIYRITVNTCLKYLRDNKAKNQTSIDEYIQIPDTETSKKETHKELYQAIGKLGEVDRLIIMMVLDELEYEEIASVIGISETNLRVKIHRIKKKLKTILSNE